MSNTKGQAETPWQEFIMHLTQFILYSATRLIFLKYIGMMSFSCLKIFSDYFLCNAEWAPILTKSSYFLIPISHDFLCPPVKPDEALFLQASSPTSVTFYEVPLPRKKGLFSSPFPPAKSYPHMPLIFCLLLDPCPLFPATYISQAPLLCFRFQPLRDTVEEGGWKTFFLRHLPQWFPLPGWQPWL